MLPVNVDPLNSKLDDPEMRAPPGARVRAWPGQAHRLRAAGAALECGGQAALAVRTLGDARRPASACAGRLAGRIPPAARSAALAAGDGAALRAAARSVRETAAAARARRLSPALSLRRLARCGLGSTPRPRRAGAAAGRRQRPHRADRGAARGRLSVFLPPTETAADYLDLLAAVEDAAAELGAAIHVEGYGPPYDPRINGHQGDARSRRHRGQHPSCEILGRPGRDHRGALRRGAADAAGHREGSCSTAATPAPAAQSHRARAATPADSPFLRRPDSAAQPDRLLAEPIRRCPICSPACSSGRPARRPA